MWCESSLTWFETVIFCFLYCSPQWGAGDVVIKLGNPSLVLTPTCSQDIAVMFWFGYNMAWHGVFGLFLSFLFLVTGYSRRRNEIPYTENPELLKILCFTLFSNQRFNVLLFYIYSRQEHSLVSFVAMNSALLIGTFPFHPDWFLISSPDYILPLNGVNLAWQWARPLLVI